ncbi:uncharacterized protein LOC128989976 [Macrosteles quadrilineatus]|uniref:uncharacterized protein LOC128989976 n=1 Tax=Macrosteles quadrilineatus TaxID=74068 RepID=UPI0023E22D89|nr:uncharacterized protein LOC128989976 [Macrosteles quadrilineatus]
MESLLNLVLMGLLALLNGAGGLRDVVIRVPVAVPTGATASLLCLYDLEGDQLYTVKWYKGKQEFFRYVLKELPHTRVFALPGINVDVVASGTEMVVLEDVQRSLTGKYKCEVSTDAPDFHTEIVSAFMHVVDELQGEPNIKLEKNSYSVGDVLRGNCSSPPSNPPANVTWYLNGEKEEPSLVTHQSGLNGTVTVSALSMELSADSFPGGKLQLRCIADLFSITQTAREMWLDEDRPRIASVMGSRDSADRSMASSTLLLQTALLALLGCNR